MLGTLVVLVLVFYGFVLLLDPYDSVPVSLDIERVQVADQQRLFYPSLARKSQFDSAIIGNSNIRLLRPDILSASLGGNWVNLAINAASSWEQEQIFKVFLRNHSKIENVLIGMDYLWCYDRYAEQKFVGATEEEDFPAWLYDDKLRNNLPPLNLATVEHSWLLLQNTLGLEEPEFGADGYTVFTDPESEYDLAKARRQIYGSSKPKKVRSVVPPVKMSPERRAKLPFTALTRLQGMLADLPEDTRVILLFVPYHSYYQAKPGSRLEIIWNECKRRVTSIAQAHGNSYVLDFMIRSDITRTDSNYWDYKHYKVGIGNLISQLISDAVSKGTSQESFRLLSAPQPVEPGAGR